MTLLLLAGILVVAAGIAGAAALAVRSKRKFQSDNEVIPGRPTTAPAAWAGAHTPEARLHRRLVAVVTALRAHPLLEEGTGMLEARVTLEEQVAAIDEQLIAVAALPARVRTDPLGRIEEQVALAEQAAADLAAAGASPGGASDTTAITAPTSTVSPSGARISARYPATGDGTSESTLSVETSKSTSSSATASPICLNHRVMVPSVTVSPNWGICTSAIELSSSAVVGRDGGGQRWSPRPVSASTDSPNSSDIVGCGWM